MIEKLFRNDISRKRWRRFRRNRVAVTASVVLLVLLFFSFTAEIWSNREPLAMSYKGQTYFPVLKYYTPTDFGRTDLMQMDYKSLELSQSDWALWPLNRWDPFERNEKLTSLPSRPRP